MCFVLSMEALNFLIHFGQVYASIITAATVTAKIPSPPRILPLNTPSETMYGMSINSMKLDRINLLLQVTPSLLRASSEGQRQL